MTRLKHDYGLAQTVAPGEQPITATEAKLQCRIEFTDEDALVDIKIAAATDRFQNETYRQLITATYVLTLDDFGKLDYILIPRSPLISVASVAYDDTAGVEQTLVEGTDYIVETDREPGQIRLASGSKVWPTVDDTPGAVRITFDAGYGAAADVPAGIKECLLMMIGHAMENREEVVTGTIATLIPAGVQRLLEQYSLGDDFLEYGQQTA